MKTMATVVSVGLLGLSAIGCASPTYRQRQSEINSAVIGALVGGGLGGVIGNNVGDNKNEALGAVIGAATGAWVGQQYGQGKDNTRLRLESLEAANQTETIMINNSNGSYTPVTLSKVGYGQYRGPRGEIYTALPSQDQLKTAYGF